jgi:hypothetical protein
MVSRISTPFFDPVQMARAYAGAAGVTGVRGSGSRPAPVVAPPRTVNVPRVTASADRLEREAARPRAAAPRDPRLNVDYWNTMSPDTWERANVVAATPPGFRAPTIDEIANAARQRSGLPLIGQSPVAPMPSGPATTTSGGGGGGGVGAGGGGGGGFSGPSLEDLLANIRSGFGGQRTAVDEALAAALGGQAGRRTAAESARDAAAAQLRQVVGDLISGAETAGRTVGDVYSQAGQRLGGLMSDYERMMAERGAAGGRTLSAFGADASMAQPGGMTAADYLAAEQAGLGRFGAVEGAYWGARPQAYRGFQSDIDTQRALQYERLMNDIANAEAAAQSQAASDRARLTTEEEQAILEAQMRMWELQQRGAVGGGGGGGGGVVAPPPTMPIPPAFGGPT